MSYDADHYRGQADTAKRAYDEIIDLFVAANDWLAENDERIPSTYEGTAVSLRRCGEFVLGDDAIALAVAIKALERVMGRAYSRSQFDA